MREKEDYSYQQKVIGHYAAVWKSQPKIYLWDKGPIENLSYDFRVLEYPPYDKRSMWTYSTVGMSSISGKDPLELHLFSAKQDLSLVELLTLIAYYHRNVSSIGLNHTVNFGKPWQEQSKCEYGFISLPYLDGPDLENFNLNGTIIKFYWLIPITKSEVEYRKKYGTEALEEKFDQGLEYINPLRNSLV